MPENNLQLRLSFLKVIKGPSLKPQYSIKKHTHMYKKKKNTKSREMDHIACAMLDAEWICYPCYNPANNRARFISGLKRS